MTYVYDQERGLAVPKWSTACPDWEQRIIDGTPLTPCKPLFQETANNYMTLFNHLPLVDVHGRPRMGEVTRPWALQFAEVFFGSLCLQTNRRLITEYFMLISKKNTKSTLAAAIMLTVLMRNQRFAAEYTIIAPTKTIADNAFKPITQFIKHTPQLQDLLHVQEHIRTITHRGTDATLKVMAADKDTVGGSKAAGVLIDELWIFGTMSRAAGVLSEATGGLASQRDGFVINLTTQSEGAPAGVFASALQYARDVRDGVIDDPTYLPIIYEHPKHILDSKEHLEPKNFYMTNPNYGLSVDEAFLVGELRKAQNKDVEEFAIFQAKHLNVQIGLVLRGQAWSAARYWEQAAIDRCDLETILNTCEVVTCGIDGGGLDDLFGLAVVGRVKDSTRWLAWVKAWVHKDVLELRKADAPLLQDLARTGDLVIFDKIGDEVAEVKDLVDTLKLSGLLDRVGIDPVRVAALLDALSGSEHLEDEDLIGISQGWRLGGAMTLVERKLAQGELRHGGQKIMQWCMGNAKVEPRGNSQLVTKQASGAGKIDPVMALLNAVELMGQNPTPKSSVNKAIMDWDLNEVI